jgi:hypothetical protein
MTEYRSAVKFRGRFVFIADCGYAGDQADLEVVHVSVT